MCQMQLTVKSGKYWEMAAEFSNTEDGGEQCKGSGMQCADSRAARGIGMTVLESKMAIWHKNLINIYTFDPAILFQEFVQTNHQGPDKRFIHQYVHLSVIYNNKK